MKNNLRMLPVILLSLPALACGGLFDFFYHGRVVVASRTVVSETREVSGFTGVDMSGMGKVVLTQGDKLRQLLHDRPAHAGESRRFHLR